METILTLENIQKYDDIILPSTPKLFESSDDPIDGSKSESFS
jgi:hypothetical protein